MMISASEAKKLVDQSEKSMAFRMSAISQVIEREAQLGNTSIILDLTVGLGHFAEFKVKKEPYHPESYTPLQKLIKAELEKNGYGVHIIKKHNSGRSSFNQMEDPEPFDSYHIEVNWR